MKLFNSSLDWISSHVFVMTFIALVVAIMQLWKNTCWNRLNATFSIMNTDSHYKQDKAVGDALSDLLDVPFASLRAPLTDKQVKAIKDDPVKYAAVRLFLNMLEFQAIAYLSGLIDREVVFSLRAGPYIRYYTIFRPYIREIHRELDNPAIYSQFEAMATKLLARKEKEVTRMRLRKAIGRKY